MQRMLFVLGLAVLSATLAGAQTRPNQCAECHMTHATAPGRGHVLDWESSVHRRSEIGCERCHGGNPATHQVLRAHFGVTNLRNPASPLNRRNVSATCGTCHSGPYSAFQKSGHAALLRSRRQQGTHMCDVSWRGRRAIALAGRYCGRVQSVPWPRDESAAPRTRSRGSAVARARSRSARATRCGQADDRRGSRPGTPATAS